jgi:hypothetical protein
MARHLVIVSRQHPDLYVYLTQHFSVDAGIEVIFDRRLVDRRREEIPAPIERRHRNRRSRPDIGAQLRERSHVIVALPYESL